MYYFNRVQLKIKSDTVPKIILEALQYLREPRGSTYEAIKKYIKYKYGQYRLGHKIIKKSLINGLECGILRKMGEGFKKNNKYQKICMLNWLQRAEDQFASSKRKIAKSRTKNRIIRHTQRLQFIVKKPSPHDQFKLIQKEMSVEENQFLNGPGWNIMKISEPGADPETITGFVLKALEDLQRFHGSSLKTIEKRIELENNEISVVEMQRKPRSEKVAKLIVEAIHDLREPDGSSITTIKRYITIRYGKRKISDKAIPEAIENGVQCGLIKKTGKRYKLDMYLVFLAKKRNRFLKKKRQYATRNSVNSNTSRFKRKSSEPLPSTSRIRRRDGLRQFCQRPGTSAAETFTSKSKSFACSTTASLNRKSSASSSDYVSNTKREKDGRLEFKDLLLRKRSTMKTRQGTHRRKSVSFSSLRRKRTKRSNCQSGIKIEEHEDKTKQSRQVLPSSAIVANKNTSGANTTKNSNISTVFSMDISRKSRRIATRSSTGSSLNSSTSDRKTTNKSSQQHASKPHKTIEDSNINNEPSKSKMGSNSSKSRPRGPSGNTEKDKLSHSAVSSTTPALTVSKGINMTGKNLKPKSETKSSSGNTKKLKTEHKPIPRASESNEEQKIEIKPESKRGNFKCETNSLSETPLKRRPKNQNRSQLSETQNQPGSTNRRSTRLVNKRPKFEVTKSSQPVNVRIPALERRLSAENKKANKKKPLDSLPNTSGASKKCYRPQSGEVASTTQRSSPRLQMLRDHHPKLEGTKSPQPRIPSLEGNVSADIEKPKEERSLDSLPNTSGTIKKFYHPQTGEVASTTKKSSPPLQMLGDQHPKLEGTKSPQPLNIRIPSLEGSVSADIEKPEEEKPLDSHPSTSGANYTKFYRPQSDEVASSANRRSPHLEMLVDKHKLEAAKFMLPPNVRMPSLKRSLSAEIKHPKDEKPLDSLPSTLGANYRKLYRPQSDEAASTANRRSPHLEMLLGKHKLEAAKSMLPPNVRMPSLKRSLPAEIKHPKDEKPLDSLPGTSGVNYKKLCNSRSGDTTSAIDRWHHCPHMLAGRFQSLKDSSQAESGNTNKENGNDAKVNVDQTNQSTQNEG